MKVLAVCPTPSDITALYRVTGPLSSLHREGKLEVQFADKLNYLDFMNCDVVLIQRPATITFREYCNFVKNWNKPLWIDYDDDLLVVPEDNPAHNLFNNEDIKKNITYCLEIADMCTVSTKVLKDKYSQWSKNIHIVPNALDLQSLPERDINWTKRKSLITWRGGNTHEKDVWSVKDQILEIGKPDSIWKFVFMGSDFKWLKWSMGDNYVYVPKADPMVYMKKLHTLSAPIHIVPLDFNEFNLSKSNIALLEATWAGSAVVAPDMPEWDGALRYKTPAEFKKAVAALIADPDLMKEQHDYAWDLIQQRFILSKVNKQRLKLISELK